MRVTHRIRPNAEQSTPSIRLYLDCECTRERQGDGSELQRLRFGWISRERRQVSRGKIITTQRWHRFTTAGEAWDIIERSALTNQLAHVYCHNWDYDAALIRLDSESTARGWRCTKWARQSHFLFARYQKANRAILFVDVLNYWQGSVEKLGESLAYHKLPIPHADASRVLWDDYCKRDVSIIQTFMHGLFDLSTQEGWGRFKPTLPGVAWHAWRHKFMDVAPLVIADDKLSAFERAAYFGGRTECFHLDRVDGPVYQLDINSSYPAAMRDNLFPSAKLHWGNRLTIDAYYQLRKRFLVVADVRLSTHEPAYPVRYDGRLIFPIGDFDTTLTTPELDYAMRRGHVVSIGKAALYKPDDLFSRYVNSLHALRLAYGHLGNRPLELACKLLLNSLYGKFGQASIRWEVCHLGYGHTEPLFDFMCTPGQGTIRHMVRGGVVWHQVKDGEASDSIPAIAAHVTAYARLKLWEYVNLAGRENVYYVDTDSLFVNGQGYLNLASVTDVSQLGKLKIVGIYAWACFRGPKDYSTDQGIKIKGIRSNATQLDANTYAQDRFTSYDQMLAKGQDGGIIVARESKHLAREYRKGVPQPDGRVEPLVLPMA